MFDITQITLINRVVTTTSAHNMSQSNQPIHNLVEILTDTQPSPSWPSYSGIHFQCFETIDCAMIELC